MSGPDDFDRATAERIRAWRESRGLSTRALAGLSGVSQPMLSNIENGRSSLSVRTLYALAEALGTGPGQLLPGGDESGGGQHLLPAEPDGAVVMNLLFASPDSSLEAYLIDQRPGYRDPEQFGHTGEDLIHIIDGRVTLTCGGSHHRLSIGDTFWLDGTVPHSFTTDADSGVRALIVTCRPSIPGDN